jgi:hypothetical protein
MSAHTHHGIPTTYRGLKFRSRLEACWAALFDRESWVWEYEPQDLDYYIPDFVLPFDHAPLLVEVKAEHSVDALRLHTEKIERSKWTGEALIVGAEPFEADQLSPVLGLIGERVDRREWLWSPARAFACLSCGNLSVLAEDLSWRCRACGTDDGNSHVGQLDHGLERSWAEAKNRVQWRPLP